MNKWILIIIGAVIVASSSLLIISQPNTPTETKPVYETGFTYYDIEKIQKTLSSHNIFVSAPTAITDNTISQYCTYFENGLPRTVEYCTTTAVTDIHGNALGNINLGGDTNSPILAIANLETATLESNPAEVLLVFETVIESLVCDCWDEEQSEDFESISAWLDAVKKFYNDSNQRNIKSKIDNLANTEISLEITTKENSVLQTLIILK
ncbi:MAG: hypothetical protein HKO48_01380 [Nitrosopumilus sp.]|nr:hypothetical protein [Nitrosopumilus sp.]NNL37312.1 hypothetical protein [Nitrosopumilus sp.]NNM35753.1 hypothetical protein [Nitrosopumilus sp.]